MKYSVFSLLLIFTLATGETQSQASQTPWESWDPATIAKANTAENADYMTSEEKLVVLITNLARTNGQLFASTFLNEYLKGEKPNKYSKSLYKDLKDVKDLPMLLPENDLFEVAKGHAIKTGKSGQVGHQGFDARFKNLMNKYNSVAENCAYGYEKAMDIALQLLIDTDVPSLGHRHNMLNPDFNSIGVSIQPHTKYRFNCVMDFGRKQ